MSLELIAIAGLGGVTAGILSSVAGLGGGLALVGIVSLALAPQEAVALTAPVIALGAVDRAWLYRGDLDRVVLPWFLAGAVPLTLVGALLLTEIPANALRVVMATLLVSYVVFQTLGRRGAYALRIPTPGFALVGMVSGVLAATAGGGGPVTAPFLHGRGLRRGPFVGTESVCTSTVNVLKSVVFAGTGLLALSLLPATAAAAVGIPLGNRAGRALLRRLSDRGFENVLMAVLVALAIRLAVQGSVS